MNVSWWLVEVRSWFRDESDRFRVIFLLPSGVSFTINKCLGIIDHRGSGPPSLRGVKGEVEDKYFYLRIFKLL